MAIGCAPKVAKFILFLFNALFWVSGLVLIIVGSVFLGNGRFKYIDQIINSSTNRNILVLFIVVGVIIFAIAFCGCCGAIKENRCLLGLYIAFLVVIIVAEFVFGVFAIVNKTAMQEQFAVDFKKTVRERYGVKDDQGKVDPTVAAMVDNLQQLFECCGADNSSDWLQSRWHEADRNQTVPGSCCPGSQSPCTNGTRTEGCLPRVRSYVGANQPVLIGVSLGVALFEVLVALCALCLCRATDEVRQAL